MLVNLSVLEVSDDYRAASQAIEAEEERRETAAALAGMRVWSAGKWQRSSLPSETKNEHRWCTRPDPFEGVWEEEIYPLLRGDASETVNTPPPSARLLR